jgi:hypothetical protein
MPKLPMNYNNAVIYKIVCNDLTITDCYVGSTTNFTKRKYMHKFNCKSKICKVYHFIRENGGWDNWSVILVEEYPTTLKLLLEQRERYWIETLNAKLNCNIPAVLTGVVSRQQYKKDYVTKNRQNNLEYQKEYYQKNRTQLLEYQKEYDEQNKELLKQNRTLRKK